MKDRLREIRQNAGLSQTAFGKVVNVSLSSVQKWESGENTPTPQVRYVICDKFGININWLETGEGERLASSQSDSLIPRLQKVLANYPALANALGAAIKVMKEEDFARLNQIIEEATKKEQP
jgi:transcriptional regulator with XRE-family HTH domain